MASRTTVTLPGADHSYPVAIGAGLLDTAGSFVREVLPGARNAFIVTEKPVAALYLSRLEKSLADAGFSGVTTATIAGGEAHKTQDTINRLYELAHTAGVKRQDVAIALGGGIIGDVTGFFAATFLRGLPFVQVPTTLLAQVDASVGGKVGINWQDLKNYIGAFYQPRGVLVDTDTLGSLPPGVFACGMAEVIKTALLEQSVPDRTFSPPLLKILESGGVSDLQKHPERMAPVILRCCQVKAAVVAADPEEQKGIRELLNLGHTFAHAYETLSQGAIPHGDAVSMGMVNAFTLARQLGQIGEDAPGRVKALLQAAHLPLSTPECYPPEAVLDVMARDKKVLAAGTLRLVLPYESLGKVRVQTDVSTAEIRATLSDTPSSVP